MSEARPMLLMGVAGEICALDARCVREILDPAPAAPVPGARPYLAHVFNVRGRVTPLADLGVRFGRPPVAITPDSRFVVVEIEVDGETEVVAVIADKVFDVCELDGAGFQKTPPVGMPWPAEFIAGFAKWRDGFVILPDMAGIFSASPPPTQLENPS